MSADLATYTARDIYRSYERPRRALMLLLSAWIGLVLYWPTLEFGSVQLRADYPLAVVMVGWVIFKGRLSSMSLFVTGGALLLGFLMLVGSINGLRLGYEYSLQIFLGFLKPFVVLVVWIEVFRYVHYTRALKLIVFLLVPAAILAMLQIVSPAAVTDLTLSWYSSEARTTASALFGEGGVGSRAIGVFESPVYSAVAFLLAALLAFMATGAARSKTGRAIFVLAAFAFLLAGFFAGSSTFLIGLFIAGALLVGWQFINVKPGRVLAILLAGSIGMMLSWYALSNSGNEAFAGEIRYQFEKIISFRFLETRFGGSNGLLVEMIEHWSEYVLFGLGATIPSYFVGDNLYLATLVRTGVFGLATVLLLFCAALYLGINSHDRNRQILVVCLLLILATGVGSPVLWIPRFNEIAMFVLAIALEGCRTRVPSQTVSDGA